MKGSSPSFTLPRLPTQPPRILTSLPNISPRQDPYFHPLLGSLVKLVFLSSALHQLTVVACSSMPYAVGARWLIVTGMLA